MIPILEGNIYGHPLLKTNMFNYVPIKHKQMSLLLSTPIQARFSFERIIADTVTVKFNLQFLKVSLFCILRSIFTFFFLTN
jgi:hypothetical protein